MFASNRKSTLGGAVGALGTFLFGAGAAFHLLDTKVPDSAIVCLVIIGFVLQGIGVFLAALFSADAKRLDDVSGQVQRNTDKVETVAGAVITGNTTLLKKAQFAEQSAQLTKPKENV